MSIAAAIAILTVRRDRYLKRKNIGDLIHDEIQALDLALIALREKASRIKEDK